MNYIILYGNLINMAINSWSQFIYFIHNASSLVFLTPNSSRLVVHQVLRFCLQTIPHSPLITSPATWASLHRSCGDVTSNSFFSEYGGSYQPLNSKSRLSLSSESSGKVSFHVLLQTKKVQSRRRVTIGHWLNILRLTRMSFQHHQWFDSFRGKVEWQEQDTNNEDWATKAFRNCGQGESMNRRGRECS